MADVIIFPTNNVKVEEVFELALSVVNKELRLIDELLEKLERINSHDLEGSYRLFFDGLVDHNRIVLGAIKNVNGLMEDVLSDL